MDPPAPGRINMERDLALLDEAESGPNTAEIAGPLLRFYTWTPACLSLGRFQPEADLTPLRRECLTRHGWDWVRRPTGGRAVFHQHEVTYCLAIPASLVADTGVRASHAELTGWINQGLRELLGGVHPVEAPPCPDPMTRNANCFASAGECDSVTTRGKLVGSAQLRRHGALLQHGSVLLDRDESAWQELFGEPDQAVSLRELLGRTVSPQDVIACLTDAVPGTVRWDPCPPP